jgi:ubiquitin carboxyl-terminal hydrolase 14
MTTLPLKVKWQRQTFDVEIDTDSTSGEDLKGMIASLTGLMDMKVMIRGKAIADDFTEWDKLKLKPGALIMVLGKVDKDAAAARQAVAKASAEAKATEWMDEGDEAMGELIGMSEQDMALPVGLENLGNTCYMNATLQALRSVTPLSKALSLYQPGPSAASSRDVDANVSFALRTLLNQLDVAQDSLTPSIFLSILHAAFPQFAERGDHGHLSQQDAEECWTRIVESVRNKVMLPGTTDRKAVDALMQFELAVTAKPLDGAGEAEVQAPRKELVFKVHIDASTNFLIAAMQRALTEEREKRDADGNNALYKYDAKFARLPAYLTVQFVRFYWKRGTQKKTKIVRPVEFPFTLDLFDMTTPELSTELRQRREALMRAENARLGIADPAEIAVSGEASSTPATFTPFPEGANDTGYYELTSIITHRGRDADGGHYVAWVKEDTNKWTLFDDDKVSRVTDADIKKLSGKGGGDWHTAYMCVYKAKTYADKVQEIAEAEQEGSESKAKKVKMSA